MFYLFNFQITFCHQSDHHRYASRRYGNRCYAILRCCENRCCANRCCANRCCGLRCDCHWKRCGRKSRRSYGLQSWNCCATSYCRSYGKNYPTSYCQFYPKV